MVEGAIFDMDGVLVDNLDFHLTAFKVFGEEQGKTLTDEQIQAVFGRKNIDMLQAFLERKLSAAEVSRFERRKEELYRNLIRPHLHERVVVGLLDFVGALRGEGFAIALATSGPRENVDMVVDELGLRGSFDATVTGDQVQRGKPHPESFLLAANGLALSPTACVVFEDSLSGVEAALRAGSKCVALATTHRENELRAVGPHRIVRDFTELRVSDLQKL
jgi:beta-phosphoglucomutase family hydrolase